MKRLSRMLKKRGAIAAIASVLRGRYSSPLILVLATTLVAWAPLLRSGGQEVSHALPIVVAIGVPIYPPIASSAHVEGTVHIKVTTDGRSVTASEIQDGPSLLATAAQANVRTWQFVPGEPTTFVVTYHYKLDAKSSSPNNPTVMLRLPAEVEVSAVAWHTVDMPAEVK